MEDGINGIRLPVYRVSDFDRMIHNRVDRRTDVNVFFYRNKRAPAYVDKYLGL